MSLPLPEPGLVISYAYLWRHEHNRGLEEGRKNRPCVIVLAVARPKNKPVRVTVAAVTHAPPRAATLALEMPPKVKRHLGLDDARSWIVLDEVNQFDWPGFDLHPVPGRGGKFAYGFIPPDLYDRATATLLAASARRKVAVVSRD